VAPRFGNKTPLVPVCYGGLILALGLSWGLVFFTLAAGRGPEIPEEPLFNRELYPLDLAIGAAGPGSLSREDLTRRLDRLERRARTPEERLSVLKRRRILAMRDPAFLDPYRGAIKKTASKYPSQETLSALEAEALVLWEDPNAEERRQLGDLAGRLDRDRFPSLVLSARVLAGDLADPGTALSVPRIDALLTGGSLLPHLGESRQRALLVNALVLQTIRGDIPGASVRIGGLEGPHTNRFAAEFYYDFGNPMRTAELLSRSAEDGDVALEADAFYLAGETGSARSLWALLAAPAQPGGDPGSREISLRSLYNLAATGPEEEQKWLETLFARRTMTGDESLGPPALYGIIRYTRFQDPRRAIAILDEEGLRDEPFLDLELLRRRLEILPPDRGVPEVWLLLNRHGREEALYRWAAWYFDRQKMYDETAQVLKNAGAYQFKGPWVALHRSLALFREGRNDEGEELLKNAGSGGWVIPANLGRVTETLSPSAALGYYEEAASLAGRGASAAAVQLRIARCLQALGRDRESRRVLDYALDLDPDSLEARHELRRLDQRNIY
jgi:tetratricopeptide (TPR) repeat protein